ncbi:hypothetical protein CCHR01_19602, partial [Colletotrichum chrysophilum]
LLQWAAFGVAAVAAWSLFLFWLRIQLPVNGNERHLSQQEGHQSRENKAEASPPSRAPASLNLPLHSIPPVALNPEPIFSRAEARRRWAARAATRNGGDGAGRRIGGNVGGGRRRCMSSHQSGGLQIQRPSPEDHDHDLTQVESTGGSHHCA